MEENKENAEKREIFTVDGNDPTVTDEPSEAKKKIKPMTLDIAEDFGYDRRRSIAFIVTLIIVAVIFVVTLNFFKVSKIIGDSMVPNLNDGDMAFVSRITGKIEHGDIVVFTRVDTDGKSKNIIKRVIGIPGDRVEILEDGVVRLNGEILKEEYLEYPVIYDAKKWDVTLKEDEYFVLGDNRDISYDSEDYGPINKKQLYGKLLFVF